MDRLALAFDREGDSTIGWVAYPDPPLVRTTSSTPPLAIAVASNPSVGLPPVRVTVGVVKPNPASATAMLETTPGEIAAVAVAGVVGVTPGEVIVTVGAAA